MLYKNINAIPMRNFFLTSMLVFLFASFSHAEDIAPGVYRIGSYFTPRSNKSLSVNNSDGSGDIITWSNTKVNAQYWKIGKVEGSDFYSITNMFTGKVLYMNTATKKVTQEISNTRNQARWEILPVDGLTSCYYITSKSMTKDNELLYLGTESTAEGAVVSLQQKSGLAESSNPQIWRIEIVDEVPNTFTSVMRDDIMNKWKTKYYKEIDNLRARIDKGGFWADAEMFEIILDAYETTGDPVYKEMFKKLHADFIGREMADWRWNDFNDDMAWMIIVCARAYLLFGDNSYLQQSKTNFDWMYSRALHPFVGLLRWKEKDEKTKYGTNSCINGPAEVACCYLAIATGDDSYYEKAKNLYALQRQYLVEQPFNGKVYDSITFNGESTEIIQTNTWSSTYNQGTYLGAALMLYNHYGDEQYKEDAIKIMDYTKKNLCNSGGIFNGECGKQVDASGDLPGFKGIFMRYARRCIVDLGKPEYADWLQNNVTRAYNNRNSVGIIWTAWQEKTTEDFKYGEFDYNSNKNIAGAAFGPSTAVSLAFNTPLDKNLIVKDAFAKIEAENFNYLKGVETSDLSEDETQIISNIKDAYWMGYHQVDFGSQTAKSIGFRVQKAAVPGQIEIRMGSSTGTLIGTADIPSTSADEWITIECNVQPTTGKQAIYLVFKGSGNLFNLNYFRFSPYGAGIRETDSGKVAIYPNLVTEFLNISSLQEGQMYIYSIDGKQIHTQKLESGDTTINMKHFQKGLYIVKANYNGNTVSKKIVKS